MIALLRAILAALAILAGAVSGLVSGAQHHEKAPVTCQEDDECWDCHAMGNGVCGTDLAGNVIHGTIKP
jgi:hypothetical protein